MTRSLTRPETKTPEKKPNSESACIPIRSNNTILNHDFWKRRCQGARLQIGARAEAS